MRPIIVLLMGAALMAPLGLATGALAADPALGVFVVSFTDIPEGLAEGSTFAGGDVLAVEPALGFAVVRLPDGAAYATATAADAGVRAVEEDAEVVLLEAPNDPDFAAQYGPQHVRAPDAWALEAGSVDTRLCVVDTGVRHTHEDVRGARWLGGVDYANGDDDPMDDNGHGTHVAGTAAASTGNGKGIAGVAQVGLLAAKVMDEKGRGRSSDVARGVTWCADNDADVITLSLGSSTPTSIMRDAVEYATGKGALVVAAAGNSGPGSGVSYPAAFPDVIAVTCTDSTQASCSFSSTGREAEIAAPGREILAPWHTGDSDYKAISGTSMSTPHVAGVAALVRSHAPDLTNDQVREVLRQTARDLGPEGRDGHFGFGLVDARAALELAASGNVSEPAPDPEPEPAPEPEPEPAPTPGENVPPRADGGGDVTVRDDDGDGHVTVTLDGTRSTDPDGEIVSYEWWYGPHRVSRDAKTTVELDVDILMFVVLYVTDDAGATSGDIVHVDVERGRDAASGA